MPTATQSHRYLQLETSLGKDALIVVRATGHERLGGLFEIALEFTRASGDLDLDSLLGTSATLGILNAGGSRKGAIDHTRYFNGFFSRISFAGFNREGQAGFHATLVPWLWFLTRTADCRIFQQKSVPDILEEVFRDAGFSDFKKDLRGSYNPREYCVQYRETDFNFVSRLMEHEGIYYYFDHENGSHKLVLCDDMVCHKQDPKHETIRFIGGAEARDTKGVITDWHFAKQVKPAKYAHNDFNFTTPVPDPNLRLLARSSAPQPQKPSPYEIYDNLGGYQTIGEGNRYARVRMEELIADRETAQARTDLIGLKSGHRFQLQKHPVSEQNREYLVTSVNWSAAEGAYGSGGGGGNFFDCDFQCIPADCTYRPARSTPLPKIEGPQTATVCGPPGEEIYVDKHGRVKVQFHWDRYGKSDAGSSCWIRVSQPWAGGGFGGMAIPRIGHEVIVECIEGDPDRPIITGRVYNGWATPPYELPANATRTTIKTNSSKGGGGFNELRFEDKKGNEQIFVHGQKNLDVRIRNRIRETNFGERHEKIGKSLFITVAQEENTHVLDTAYEMTKDNHLTVDGGLSTKVNNDSKHFIGKAHVLNAKDLIIETSTSVSIKTNKITLQGAQGVHVRGMQINVEGTSLCLKSGGSFVSITPAGVVIQGPTVLINSGGSASAAEQPPATPDIAVLEPLDASPAPEAVPGKMRGGGRGLVKPKQRGGGPVKLHLAPPYTPPPDNPLPIVSPPVIPKKDDIVVCGGPYKLKDKQGRRGNGLTIEIVPESLMGGDTITVSAEKGCSCAGAKVTVGAASSALNAPAKVAGWCISDDSFTLSRTLGRASPRIVPIGLTCARDNSSISSGEARVYPSDKVEIKAEIKELCKKCPAIDGLICKVASVLSHLTQMPIDPYKGISFNQGLGRVTIAAPTLSLNYEAQWKEYPAGKPNEWQAYYAWKAGVGATLSIEYKLDLIAVGIASTGVGAGVLVFFNKIKDALGQDDPLIYIGFKAELTVSGSVGYEEKVFGSIEGKGTGSLSIGAGITTSVVEASCEAYTNISCMVEGRGSATGLKVSYELFKWGGVAGKVSAKLHIGKLISVGYERSVQLIDPAGPLCDGSLGD